MSKAARCLPRMDFREYEDLCEWMPEGRKHRNLVTQCACIAENKACCLLKDSADCLSKITPEEVFRQAS